LNYADVPDIERNLPGVLDEIRQWFKVYKIAEGKGENKFALNGEYQNAKFTWNLIADGHDNLFNFLPKHLKKPSEKQSDRPTIKRGKRR